MEDTLNYITVGLCRSAGEGGANKFHDRLQKGLGPRLHALTVFLFPLTRGGGRPLESSASSQPATVLAVSTL